MVHKEIFKSSIFFESVFFKWNQYVVTLIGREKISPYETILTFHEKKKTKEQELLAKRNTISLNICHNVRS